MKAMMAHFSLNHLVAPLPESLYDLANRNDSTYTGRLVGVCVILLSANVSVYLGKQALQAVFG